MHKVSRDLVRVLSPVRSALAMALVVSLWGCGSDFEASGKKLVVLGIDGMDPDFLQQFVDEGKMPNFEELMKSGSFRSLGTSNPPQSPVAWSSFITGYDPGGHGVFDFLHRDPAQYTPASSTQTTPATSMWSLPGKYQMPSPFGEEPEAIRQGTPFWDRLGERGIRADVYRMPAAYPIQDTDQLTMSDMGTPDLQGGISGTYFYYSEETPTALIGDSLKMHQVTVDDHKVYASIPGPPSLFIKGEPHSKAPFAVYLDPEEPVAYLEIEGGDSLVLDEKAWSGWYPVRFDVGLKQTVSGITRFYLKEVRPVFKLYVAPVQIDPLEPAFPISTPDDAVVDLAEVVGRFYTAGLAEDVIALKEGALDDGEFLQQTDLVTDERLLLMDYAADRFDDGCLFIYFSTIDLRCHMMFRHITPGHPARDDAIAEQYKDSIEAAYIRVDQALGRLRQRLGNAVDIMVLSDHGFSPLVRKVNLNKWLLDNGYLNLDADGKIDWSRTRAYSMGFNGLYINLAGREAQGIVSEAERAGLVKEIADGLLLLRDDAWKPDSQVVLRADRREEIYHGDHVVDAPDLVVGYNRGYGATDDSALGAAPTDSTRILIDNTSKWSGSHLMAPEVVPGILVTSFPIQAEHPKLEDVTATILQYFGVPIPDDLVGKPIL